ncbi:recombinase family protein [Brachybacterium halotolerans subsp. kimchii]|uniref:recombinase family protein n=1 Tax=Brachybacterium halotolerans TaxID=2795215 RepID=UPI001E596674|nr:recombinase family protein [Brachybacterium halotolerans]UEJ82680.1 recombinase family protein [Brachybacterium halotolerans subsp. kimchii]
MAARRAVVYMRQSTYREESISLELQESACRQYAHAQGYEVVAVEADPGISGRTFDRPAVRRVMTMVEDRQADVIILWKWSRLSRSRKDWAVAADTVEQAGGAIESATEAIDTSTSTGRLARGVMVEFAAFESERIGDGWREAHARRLAEGRPANGKARFGYRYDRDQKLHIPDPITGPVLADAYRRYLAGESVYSLTQWIRSTGVEPAAGYGSVTSAPWHSRTLRRVLDSGFGAGKLLVRGEYHDGIHEPVITPGEWARYQRRREERSARPRGERSEYLLSGLIRCGVCGGRMQYSKRPARESGPQIRCREGVEGRAHGQGITLAAHAERAVETWVGETAAQLEGAVDLDAPVAVQDPTGALERELEKTYDAMGRLAMRLAEEKISEEAHARAAATFESRLRQLQGDLEAARERAAAPPPLERDVVRLAEDWLLLDVPARREELTLLLEDVTVTAGGRYGKVHVEVHPRVGEPRSFEYVSR